MGLALLIVILKTGALRTGEARYDEAARFWGKIFGLGFAMGVVTGIPMEFQFGTNRACFSEATGGVIGQTLAMEGVFAFFLESTFQGSWLSAFFPVATNAFMQHPVGYEMRPDGTLALTSFWALIPNPWLLWQYLHTMMGSAVTGSVVMAAVGAYYVLVGRRQEADEPERRASDFGRLFDTPAMLWVLMLAAPFPFIANTTSWMTAELGRQPWLVYGILRTHDGYSATVPAWPAHLYSCRTDGRHPP